jgi:hypothetical protein
MRQQIDQDQSRVSKMRRRKLNDSWLFRMHGELTSNVISKENDHATIEISILR